MVHSAPPTSSGYRINFSKLRKSGEIFTSDMTRNFVFLVFWGLNVLSVFLNAYPCLNECQNTCKIACQFYSFRGKYELDISCGHNATSGLTNRWLLQCQSVFSRMKIVNLHEVDLTSVPDNMALFPDIQLLYLTDNKIVDVTPTTLIKLSKLETLALDRNRITILWDSSFVNLENLRRLTLSQNRITTIQALAFTGSFPNLELLDLRDNKLQKLDSWPLFLFRNGLHAVRRSRLTLKLDSNFIREFTNERRWAWTEENIRVVKLNISLSDNKIQSITNTLEQWNFRIKQSQVLMTYRPVYFTSFLRNALKCDCREYNWLQHRAVLQSLANLKDTRCYLQDNLLPQRFEDIQARDLYCKVNCSETLSCRQYPSNKTVQITPRVRGRAAFPSLADLYVSSVEPNYKYSIDFSNTPLTNLNSLPKMFLGASRLNLSRAGIRTIAAETRNVLKTVQIIDLRQNLLQTLPKQFSTMSGVKQLLLSGNLWSCSCDNMWFVNWLQNSGSNFVSDSLSMVCASPANMTGKSILKLRISDLCQQEITESIPTTSKQPQSRLNLLPIIIGACSGVLLVLICISLCYCSRVRVWTLCHLHPFNRDECHGEGKVHDILLHFHPDDAPWVIGVLSEKLVTRRQPYDVCIRTNTDLDDNILPSYRDLNYAIENSKRIVVILSPSYARDDDLLTELVAILRHPHPYTAPRTLIIRLNKTCGLSGAVEKLLTKRKIYQLWHGANRPRFWEQLFYWLPVNPVSPPELPPPTVSPCDTPKYSSLRRLPRSNTLTSCHNHPLLRSASTGNWNTSPRNWNTSTGNWNTSPRNWNTSPRMAETMSTMSVESRNGPRSITNSRMEATFV